MIKKRIYKISISIIILTPLCAVLLLLFSFGAYRLVEHCSYHDCVCDVPLTFGEYSSAALAHCGNAIAPKLYSEQELLSAMNTAFDTEFTIVRKNTFSRQAHTYIMIPAFDQSLEITVKTWSDCGYDYAENGKPIPYVERYADHDYYQAVLTRAEDNITAAAKAYGLSVDIDTYQTNWKEINVIVKSYEQIDEVVELYRYTSDLLDLRSFSSPTVPSPHSDTGQRALIMSDDGIRIDIELNSEVFGYDPHFGYKRHYVNGAWIPHNGIPADTALLDRLQRSYATYIKRNRLSDPTIPPELYAAVE